MFTANLYWTFHVVWSIPGIGQNIWNFHGPKAKFVRPLSSVWILGPVTWSYYAISWIAKGLPGHMMNISRLYDRSGICATFMSFSCFQATTLQSTAIAKCRTVQPDCWLVSSLKVYIRPSCSQWSWCQHCKPDHWARDQWNNRIGVTKSDHGSKVLCARFGDTDYIYFKSFKVACCPI